MFERILLPLDGSEMSEMAVPYGEEIARNLGSELILLHVREPNHRPGDNHVHEVYLERLAEVLASNVSNDLSRGKSIKISKIVETGEPAENICNMVEKKSVDLIIISAVSISGLKIGKMLGSVADHICRTVPVPVLLLRSQGIEQKIAKKRLINQILLPLDGSNLSKLALPVGEELAGKLNVGMTLFQMANRIRLYDDGLGTIGFVDYSRLDADKENRVRSEMIAIQKELADSVPNITTVVTSGFDAASAIIETGKKVNADLVIMSTNGRSGLGRWLFGNVAEKVLRYGDMPLLLVHARAG